MLKALFIVIIILHALIHLMGWMKAYDLADLPQFTKEVSRPGGLLWLLAGLLFGAAATLLLVKKDAWWLLGLLAIALSQILIIIYWQDAKFGTIANGLILIGLLLGYGQWSFNRMTESELNVLLQKETSNIQRASEEKILQLPPIVQKWIIKSGALEKENVQTVHLQQTGEMKISPGGKWLAVKAKQWFTLEEPGFLWKADMGRGSLMQFAGRDKLVEGKGSMLIKLFSLINVVNAANSNIDQGAALRYLAEMVWFPQAAVKPFISWESTGPLTAKATLRYDHSEVSGTFTFNEKGQALRFKALRYYQETGTTEPWVIEINEKSYTAFSGVQIPKRASVTWQLPGGDFTWYEVKVTDAYYYSGLQLK